MIDSWCTIISSNHYVVQSRLNHRRSKAHAFITQLCGVNEINLWTEASEKVMTFQFRFFQPDMLK